MYERNKDIENLKPYFEKFILPGNTKQKKEMVGWILISREVLRKGWVALHWVASGIRNVSSRLPPLSFSLLQYEGDSFLCLSTTSKIASHSRETPIHVPCHMDRGSLSMNHRHCSQRRFLCHKHAGVPKSHVAGYLRWLRPNQMWIWTQILTPVRCNQLFHLRALPKAYWLYCILTSCRVHLTETRHVGYIPLIASRLVSRWSLFRP